MTPQQFEDFEYLIEREKFTDVIIEKDEEETCFSIYPKMHGGSLSDVVLRKVLAMAETLDLCYFVGYNRLHNFSLEVF